MLAALFLETPLLFLILLTARGGDYNSSRIALLLIWYHVIPLSVLSFTFLRLFGHGEPSFGNIELWHLVYWGLVFVIQVALTTPPIFLVLKLIGRVRTRGRIADVG